MFSYAARVWKRKPALIGQFGYFPTIMHYYLNIAGLSILVLLFLTTVYHSTNTPPAETVYAEKLVRVHEKLQQVSEDIFEPVSFIQPAQGSEAR